MLGEELVKGGGLGGACAVFGMPVDVVLARAALGVGGGGVDGGVKVLEQVDGSGHHILVRFQWGADRVHMPLAFSIVGGGGVGPLGRAGARNFLQVENRMPKKFEILQRVHDL